MIPSYCTPVAGELQLDMCIEGTDTLLLPDNSLHGVSVFVLKKKKSVYAVTNLKVKNHQNGEIALRSFRP